MMVGAHAYKQRHNNGSKDSMFLTRPFLKCSMMAVPGQIFQRIPDLKTFYGEIRPKDQECSFPFLIFQPSE